MWKESEIFLEDLKFGADANFIPWDEFSEKTFFVTGATGLIGYTLTSLLLYHSIEKKSKIKVLALVRDIEKAKKQFRDAIEENAPIEFIEGSVEDFSCNKITQKIDYVIHGACPTASEFFTEHPVETIHTILNGTDNVLRLCVAKKVQSAVFLSSMEVYGEVTSRIKLSEDNLGKIDILNPRSSYPESKRMAETMCACYASEYALNVKSLRLAQTFGPGVKYNDNRVFAYMMRCVLENADIELKTSGEKENPYLYTMDAATAILTVLAKGVAGKSYNAANEKTYCSVKQMGEIMLKTFKKENLQVRTNVGNADAGKYYPQASKMNLSSEKLEDLGWQANYELENMYRNINHTNIAVMRGGGYRPNGFLNMDTEKLHLLGWKCGFGMEDAMRNAISIIKEKTHTVGGAHRKNR